jgi:hypothetical protein
LSNKNLAFHGGHQLSSAPYESTIKKDSLHASRTGEMPLRHRQEIQQEERHPPFCWSRYCEGIDGSIGPTKPKTNLGPDMKKPSKRKTKRNDQDLVFVPIDLPIELEEKLRAKADKAGLTLNDYLSKVTSERIERYACLSLHPVKSLTFGSVVEQDQLAPIDLLPVPVQFENSHQG